MRASTLRHWDAEGLVTPDRLSGRGTRRYSPAQVRDAGIVHQLRSAGYRIDPLRTLIPACGAGTDGRSRWAAGRQAGRVDG
ncbi:MerR family transcriptional regulator [Streptomyces sp. NPDC050448]|uniref:MerR family transcriptional regulator n=1 Tax=Streptomyces sp. NPDC050448 TaxID=3155404 RepID=UPI00341A1E22